MPAATRKRMRDSAAAETPTVSTRSALASRVAQTTPPWWQHAAASAGVTGADAFLVDLGRSIAAALQSLRESAETVRAQLRESRMALHGAIDARCDELGVGIDSAEATKAAALERELVACDAALERWRAESGAVRDALSSQSDAELAMQHAALSSRLDAMDVLLQALPTAVVEPPRIALVDNADSLLPSIACFGRILVPLPVTVADLTLEGVPSSVRPGDFLKLRLSLGMRHAKQSTEELDDSLGMLVGATRIDATLEGPGVEPQSVSATLTADSAHHCLRIAIQVPVSVSGVASEFISVRTVSVAGRPVPCLPVQVPVRRGIAGPLLLTCNSTDSPTTPSISLDGRIYCPRGLGPDVLVFDSDGAPLPGIPVASIGMTECTKWSALVNTDAPTLLLADWVTGSTRLVAIDPATRAVRWTSAVGSFQGCFGIAALPTLGVVAVSDGVSDLLVIHRISDGYRVGSLELPNAAELLAADNASNVVYGSVYEDGYHTVHAWLCATDGANVRISAGDFCAASGKAKLPRVLAVMPPAPGKRTAHLVVGLYGSSELLVLSLPSLTVVHTHNLRGVRMMGLAADPWGGALAVCDIASLDMAFQAIDILAWPLPGMPPLQD